MKVGILTFHHIPNYGATLQAYALYKFIQSQGHEVEMIDYRPYKAVLTYLKGNLLKSWKIRMFLLSQMTLSPKKTYTKAGLDKLTLNYDAVICGSDQIWSLNPIRGFDTSFYLDFVADQKSCRKISYAPSFGETKALKENQETICKLINKFYAVSVRDTNSVEVLKKECNIEAVKVLDPTFLVEYSEIISLPKIKEEYLLLYTEGDISVKAGNYVKSLAENKNLKIVAVGFRKIAQKNLISLSPEEWLGYFNRAAYVVTNTFHGTIFSIIFKKQFTILPKKNKNNKIPDLLEQLGLESRITSRLEYNPDKHDSIIDYDLVDRKLAKEIIKSKDFLLGALDS